MADKVNCEECNRTFKDSDGLTQHNASKHNQSAQIITPSNGSDNSTIKITKGKLYGFLFVIIMGVFLFWAVSGSFGSNGTGNVIAVSGEEHILGNPDAPVSIIEYSDYQCPVCQRFWQATLPDIKREYIDTGKVNLVYRNFPLTHAHPMAQASAEAAECVAELGGNDAYFEYHDTLFSNQHSLSNNNLKIWAQNQGFDISECLDSGKYRRKVQSDFANGQSQGVRGTPSFFVNGQAISGAQPFSVFQRMIESNL